MTIEDKTFLLNICEMPRLGLSQQQIADIERVIDGRPSPTKVIAVSNAKAAEIRRKAEEAIERDKKRAMNEIKDEISEIVIMAATKVVEKEISEKDNENIISQFLANVGTAE